MKTLKNTLNTFYQSILIAVIAIGFTAMPFAPGMTAQTVEASHPTNTVYVDADDGSAGASGSSTEPFDTIQEAVDHANSGDTVELLSDFTTSEEVDINKEVTLEGNGYTIDAAFSKTLNSNNSAIKVGADDVTIQNVVVDGENGTDLHGINVYTANDVGVHNVTAKNFRIGLLVNGSTVNASDITTSGNIWHGINVDQGGGVTQPAILNISNTSSHDENSPTEPEDFEDGESVPDIFIDDATGSTDATVNDLDSQYISFEVDFRGGIAKVFTLKETETVTVSDDTSAGYGQSGWLFNRDTSTQTEFEFNNDEASIGDGALHVFPIDGSINGADDKFIGEYFTGNMLVEDLDSVSYDFQIAGDGVSDDANHFYTNVHANFPGNENNYGDCKFDYVPDAGTPGSFETFTFESTDTPDRVRGTDCPATLAEMQEGSTIFFFSLNVGDTSNNDDGLAGYYDKVVLNTDEKITTFDFEKINLDDDENEKIAVCHMPPGNPDNAHTIYVSENAVQAHENHGDELGECSLDEEEGGIEIEGDDEEVAGASDNGKKKGKKEGNKVKRR